MAKINHNNPFKTISDLIENAKEQHTVHLYAEDSFLNGNSLQIKGKKCWHFATTGYLGLEQDIRLKSAGAEAIMKYGTQFPLSKTYISHPLYAELEALLKQMFGQEVIICKNSTLAHLGIIPQLVDYDEVVILDHQVHWSVQQACSMLKNKGCVVELVRHNNLEQLEALLIKYRRTKKKIWYMADGIYSMFGDHAPIEELKNLCKKYSELHLYFDDVHGMSWKGTHGTGFVKAHFDVVPPNVTIVATLSKTFGASGAVVICGDAIKHNEIKNFGGPLTFSAQLEPAAVATAIASAKIHLSEEIYKLQDTLYHKIALANGLFTMYDLPIISFAHTPVFYLGTALPQTAFNLVNFLHAEGFFVNPGIYPAVPMRNAGLRITVSNHNANEQITDLITCIAHHFQEALNKTNNSRNLIDKAFKIKVSDDKTDTETKYVLKSWNSISEIEEELWNEVLGNENALDYQGFTWLEKTFNSLDTSNINYMSFKYYGWFLHNECIALTAVTESIWKEDVLATAFVSDKVEQIRKENPLFLCAKAWSIASPFTEGKHLYIKDNDIKILEVVVDDLLKIFEATDVNKFFFRDFDLNKKEEQLFFNKGLVKIQMPDTCIFKWNQETDITKSLSKKDRRHFKNDILPFIDVFDLKSKKYLNNEELDDAYKLYAQVKNNNLAINNFMYDKKVFEAMNAHQNWEFIVATLPNTDKIIGCVFCYVNHTNKSYNPILIGLFDDVELRLKLYRQLLYKTITVAQKMEFETVFLGFSAVFEKKKLGAQSYPKFAYVLVKENFDTDQLSNFEN